jgi:cysteine desulfurase
LGLAAELAREQQVGDAAHARDLAARLWRELESIPGVIFNGHREYRLPGLINVSFPGVEGESLITGLSGIAVSSGSACSSSSREPSYVLRALGRGTELAQSSLRLSLGRFSRASDVDHAATAIRAEVSRLRQLAGDPVAFSTCEGPQRGLAPPADSLLGRALNPLAQRYFLAPARRPRFAAGQAPSGVRQGRAGSQPQGTEVSFELEVAPAGPGQQTVKSSRFSAYGCPHTLAVAAWVCEVLEGRRFDAGLPGKPAEWAEKFAVPAEKLGRLLVVEDALRAAFESRNPG